MRDRGRRFNLGSQLNKVLDLSDQKRQRKQQKYTSTEAGLQYRKVNRELRKKMKASKEEWWPRPKTISQQWSKIAVENPDGVLQWPIGCATMNSIQTLAYSRVTRPHTRGWKPIPVLREEVEESVCSLKAGKAPGLDNIPSEFLKNGGEATTTVMIVICIIYMPEDLGGEGMARGVANSITHHILTKESQPQAMSELLHCQPNQPSPARSCSEPEHSRTDLE